MKCSPCGHDNPSGSRFCNACGARLQPTTAALAPQAYTPQHLSQKILTSRSALEGERKQVTVLFADLKGSMELLADRDPEEARRLLDAVLERMMEAVHRYEGTVNQVMGDGIMALFGAPLAHEDHAVRACYAALRMQDRVTRYAAELEQTEGVMVRIRVGLNSGEVVVRSIGSDLHMDYTAVGQTTHLAARMEQMATPGSILIAPSTLRLAEAAVTVRSLGPRPVKGLEGPIEIYELVGAVAPRSILKSGTAERRSRFVGRQVEFDRLTGILATAERGFGQIAAITAEPGLGKSRLVYEFVQSPAAREWQVLESRSLSYETSAAWAPIIELMQRYFGLDGRESAKEIAPKISEKILGFGEDLGDIIAPLTALLEALPPHHAWHALDAQERRRRVLDALTRLILAESERQPLLLVFENLQWVDTETRAFLERLVERVSTARLMLLVDYRPEFEHDWAGRPGFTEIVLGPLSQAAADELLEAMLGNDRALAPLKQLLVERSQGNPFFLEEIVRTLVETKVLLHEHNAYRLVLVQEHTNYRLARDLRTLEVPASVQAVLAARIDRLPFDSKLLLQSAAVIGMTVPAALLGAATGLPSEGLEIALAQLVAAGFLEQTQLYPDLEYRFRNALTRDVASASLLREQRRVLHERVVAAIESLYSDRLSAWIDQLAHHASRAELWPKAALYNRQAGARAAAHAANVEAARAYEAALEALSRLPQTRETIEASIDIRLELRAPLLQRGRLDEVLAVSRDAERIARELGDESRLARVYTYLVNLHYLKGETDAAIDYGQRCLAVGSATGDVALQSLARQYMGQSHHLRGDYARAESVLRDNLGLDPDSSGTAFVASCGWVAWSLAERGEFEAAYACLDPAHRAAERSRHAYSQAIAWTMAGLVATKRGDMTHAVLPLGRSVEISRRKHLTVWQPIPSSLLGLAFVRMGHVPQGLRLLEDSVSLSRELGVRAYLASWILNLAEGYLLDQQYDRAVASAQEALDLAQSGHERAHEAYARHLLGAIAARKDSVAFEEALASYQVALGLAEKLGLRPLSASVHRGLTALYARQGNEAAAKHHAQLADKLAGKLGLYDWGERREVGRDSDRVLVVARTNTDLYDFLTQELAGAQGLKVVLDRRQRQRRQTRASAAVERRRGDRRHTQVDDDLVNWQLAMAAPPDD